MNNFKQTFALPSMYTQISSSGLQVKGCGGAASSSCPRATRSTAEQDKNRITSCKYCNYSPQIHFSYFISSTTELHYTTLHHTTLHYTTLHTFRHFLGHGGIHISQHNDAGGPNQPLVHRNVSLPLHDRDVPGLGGNESVGVGQHEEAWFSLFLLGLLSNHRLSLLEHNKQTLVHARLKA